jgi:hypothetical protein
MEESLQNKTMTSYPPEDSLRRPMTDLQSTQSPVEWKKASKSWAHQRNNLISSLLVKHWIKHRHTKICYQLLSARKRIANQTPNCKWPRKSKVSWTLKIFRYRRTAMHSNEVSKYITTYPSNNKSIFLQSKWQAITRYSKHSKTRDPSWTKTLLQIL